MENFESFSLKSEYNSMLNPIKKLEYGKIIKKLSDSLPSLWSKKYKEFSHRLSDICIINHKTFDYIFDDVQSDNEDFNNTTLRYESRIVAVYGKSDPQKRKRDDGRFKGWLGKTEKIFGISWDKGHFIANSIGGVIDGVEINAFPQNRSLNRGWSDQGKVYRKMEDYCFNNPGIFCFSRPIYFDESFRPSLLEYGLLKFDNSFWIEIFDNR